MKKITKILLLVLSIGMLLSIGVYLLTTNSSKYAIIIFAFAIVVAMYTFSFVSLSGNDVKAYEARLKVIISTYDAILAKSNNLPNLEGKNIIKIEVMDDLVDIQTEVRKPICYFKQTDSCSFVMIDGDQAYVHDEKLNDGVISPLEIEINNVKQKEKNKEDMDSEMLKNIDNTTIVKLSNKKSYKVSPIRKDKEKAAKKEEATTKNEKFEFFDSEDEII